VGSLVVEMSRIEEGHQDVHIQKMDQGLFSFSSLVQESVHVLGCDHPGAGHGLQDGNAISHRGLGLSFLPIPGEALSYQIRDDLTQRAVRESRQFPGSPENIVVQIHCRSHA
jgi:hypothetical protein